MPDSANSTLIVGGRVDLTLDVKTFLIARLQQEFKEASGDARPGGETETGFPLVDVSSGWPVVDANFPCMAVLGEGQQQRDQFVGHIMGQDEQDRNLRGSSYHEGYTIWIFSLKAPERDLLSRLVELILRVASRDLAAIEGIESVEMSGGIDQQDMDSKGRVQYMTVWTLSLVNPHVDGPAPDSVDDTQYRVTHVDVEGEFE